MLVACIICCKFAADLSPDSTDSSQDKYLLTVIESYLISNMSNNYTTKTAKRTKDQQRKMRDSFN